MRKRSLLFTLLLAMILVVAACGSDDKPSTQEPETPGTVDNETPQEDSNGKGEGEGDAVQNIEDSFSTDEVTLTLYSNYAAINNDDDVEAIFGPVIEKYPNISIELIKGQTLYDMLAAGEVPDLLANQHYHMAKVLDLDVGINMDEEFVKKFDVDLDRFAPQVIDAIRSYDEDGVLLSIPYTLNYGVLLYNKDIFDRFGLEYPADGMTWDETIELAKSLTRLDEGVQYIGLNPGSERTIVRGLSAPTVNEDGTKAMLNTPPYEQVFSMLRSFYQTPGVVREDGNYSWGWNHMLQDQNLAMFPTWIAAITSRLVALEQEGGGMDWDLAAHPVFAETPEFGREVEFQSIMVPPTTKNKDAALQVIWSLISDEVQEKMNRGSNLTILDRPDLRNEFAADAKIYDDKNLEGVFSVDPAPTPRPSRFDADLYSILREEFNAVIKEGKDINSALRDANEKADNFLETENR